MRFSDFIEVNDILDIDFIVGYSGFFNKRISISKLLQGQMIGQGTSGFIPKFTSQNVLNDSQIFESNGSTLLNSTLNSDFRLAVFGSLEKKGMFVSSNIEGAVIEALSGANNILRLIGQEGDVFTVPYLSSSVITSTRRISHPDAVNANESATLGQTQTLLNSLENFLQLQIDGKVNSSLINQVNGIAGLDSSGKIPLSLFPDSILGQVKYQGTWDVLTNTPTLANPPSSSTKGDYYVVVNDGAFAGIDFQEGDWIISNGSEWERVKNTDAVTTVFGRLGAILAIESDYEAFYPKLSEIYMNPSWIGSLEWSKITNAPAFLTENQDITLSGDITGTGKTSIVTSITNGSITNEKLRASNGLSVIGRSVSSPGEPSDIIASSDNQVLRRSGSSIGFGTIGNASISDLAWSKITGTPTTLSGYGITNAYSTAQVDSLIATRVPNSRSITINGDTQDLSADRSWTISFDTSGLVPNTRIINTGTGLLGGGNLSIDRTISFDVAWGDARYLLLSSIANYVPYTGATQNVNLGEFGLSTGHIVFDTTPTNTPSVQGTMAWDTDTDAISVILNGYKQIVGGDVFYNVKNQSGSSIPKGTAVRFAGTVGASGRLLIAPFLASVPGQSSTFFMGVTAETIANGADGKVLWFGTIRGINTDSFNEGDILYASTTTAGAFQTAVPQAPNNIVQIAAVITKHPNNGAIFIRPTIGSDINKDEGVKITTPATGQLLQLQANNLWENKTLAQILGGTSSQFVKGDGSLDSTEYVTITTGQFITGIKTFNQNRLRLAAVGSSQPTYLSNTGGLTTGTGGHNTFGFNGLNNIFVNKSSDNGFILVFNNTSNQRIYTLQDASGTIAFTSDITTALNNYVTLDTTQSITGAKSFSANTVFGSTSASDGFQVVDIVASSNRALRLRGNSTSFFGSDMSIVRSGANSTTIGNGPNIELFNTQTNRAYMIQQSSDSLLLGYWNGSGWSNVINFNNTGSISLGAQATTTSHAVRADRTITINGVTFDLTENRSWTVSATGNFVTLDTTQTITGAKTFDSGTLILSSVGTANPTILRNTNGNATASAGTNSLGFNFENNLYLAKESTNNAFELKFDNTALRSYTLQDASGTLAFTSDIPANIVTGSGTNNFVPKFTPNGTTLGNSQIFDNGTNVGIGTTSPSNKLDIQDGIVRVHNPSTGTGGSSVFFRVEDRRTATSGSFTSGYQIADFGGVTSEILLQHNAFLGTRNLLINHNGATRLSITSGGNVGIGTTSTSERLQVNGNITLTDANDTLFARNIRSHSGASLYIEDSSGDRGFRLTSDGVAVYNGLAVGSSNPASAPSNGLFVSGNVGIGTTSPSEKLEVDGTLRVLASGITNYQSPNSGGAYISSELRFGNSNQVQEFITGAYAPMIYSTSFGGSIGMSSSLVLQAGGTGSNRHIYLRTSDQTRVFINNNGNVGIGTASPSALLDVDADILVNGLTVGRGAGNIDTNTVIGANALSQNTTGSQNTAIGINALSQNTTGVDNTAVGLQASRENTTGSRNTSIGLNALIFNTVGSENTSIGRDAGRRIANGNIMTSSDNSCFIGFDTRALSNNETNQIVIGHEAVGIGSNSVVLGNTDITTTVLRGNVGIGTTSPNARLEVNSSSLDHFRMTRGSVSVDLQVRADGDLVADLLGGNYFDIRESGDSKFRFRVNGNSYLNGGNVGIGTTSPAAKLHVDGNTLFGGSLFAASAPTISLSSGSTADFIFSADPTKSVANTIIISVSTFRVDQGTNTGRRAFSSLYYFATNNVRKGTTLINEGNFESQITVVEISSRVYKISINNTSGGTYSQIAVSLISCGNASIEYTTTNII